MSLPKFENNVFDFGNIARDAELEFEFVFEGDRSQIDYISTGCGACTDAWIDGNSIKGTYSAERAQNYNEGTTKVAKSIQIFYDPDQPEFVADEKGRRVRNELKRTFVLHLRSEVTV